MIHSMRSRGSRLALACLLGFAVPDARGAQPPPVREPSRLVVGVNVARATDWDPTQVFADVMKQARRWGTPAEPWNGRAPMDAEGWPTDDAGTVLMTGIPKMAGTYRLSFTGNATVETHSASDHGTRVLRQSYDASRNLTTAEVTVGLQEKNLFLVFKGQPGGVRDVSLVRPGHEAGELFNQQFLARLQRFQVLRFMDFTSTNGNEAVSWEDRKRPGSATQQQRPDGKDVGAAWEYVVRLANQTHKDIWINVPHLANDEYVTRLAQLLRYGSDGVNPYTRPEEKPVFPPLDPGLRIYVEWSNELWNGGFAQSRWLERSAEAMLAAGSAGDLLPVKGGGKYAVMFRWVGRRTAQVSDIFRSVFGDAEMMRRVRPVLAGQLANAGTVAQALDYLRARPGGVARYVYGISAAPYFRDLGPDGRTDLTLDVAFREMDTYIETKMRRGVEAFGELAKKNGVKLLAYEGGQHLVGTGSLDVKAAAQVDPRMKDLLRRTFAMWGANGGELFMYYSLCSGWGRHGFWGLSNDVSSESTPKWEAIQELAR